jgi:putative ABC transport system permease protein
VGTFTFDDVLSARDFVLINNAYFDAARLTNKGTVQLYSVIVSDPKLAASVAEDIDRKFANSANETSTQSVRELAQSQIQSIGNVNFVIRTIVSVVFVALLLSTTAMMMQSIRERTPELAVLKACGFSDRKVFGLVLVEAVVVCVGAAVFGLVVATCTFIAASKVMTGLSMPASVVAVGLCLALLVAFITAYPPAFRASRLQIVEALAGR